MVLGEPLSREAEFSLEDSVEDACASEFVEWALQREQALLIRGKDPDRTFRRVELIAARHIALGPRQRRDEARIAGNGAVLRSVRAA